MHLKSVFALTVEEAIARARQELGEDAMLVHSRPAPPETRHLGAYEVVFAAADTPEPQRTAREPAARPKPEEALPGLTPADHRASPPEWRTLARDVAQLRMQLEACLQVIGSAAAPGGMETGSLRRYHKLVAAGVEPALAQQASAAGGSWAAIRAAMVGMTAAVTGVAEPELSAVTAVVGPPGAGKTTTLVKLAIRFGVLRRRPVRFVALDTFRVGFSEQLKVYARILGAECRAVDSLERVARSLPAAGSQELVLVDTAGGGPKDMDYLADVAGSLRQAGAQVQLVLPASTHRVDLLQALERYRRFNPERLIFTRLDETSQPGAAWSTAVRAAIPVAFLGTGQVIPEDLEEASPGKLADWVLQAAAAEAEPATECPADPAAAA